MSTLAVVACTEDYELERRGGALPEPGGPEAPDAGTAGAGGAPDDLLPFCEAFEVVQAKCQRCHGSPLQNAAPVPFLSYEDLVAPYYDTELEWWEVAVNAVEQDFMPYVSLNGSPFLEGGAVEPLTADEKDSLLTWLKQGAQPEGGTDCP